MSVMTASVANAPQAAGFGVGPGAGLSPLAGSGGAAAFAASLQGEMARLSALGASPNGQGQGDGQGDGRNKDEGGKALGLGGL